MYRFQNEIEDERDIDIRTIECGHWPASRLTTRTNGKWQQFIDIETKSAINQAIPVDYKKKYHPPKRNKPKEPHISAESSFNLYKEAVLTLAPHVVKEIQSSTLASTKYNIGPFEEPVFPYNSTKIRKNSPTSEEERQATSRSSTLGRRESLVLTATKRKTGSTTARTTMTRSIERKDEKNPTLKQYDFSAIRVPETARIVNKRHGDNPEKFPFKISPIYISQLSEPKQVEVEKQPLTVRSISVNKKEEKRAATSYNKIRTQSKAGKTTPRVPTKTFNKKKPLTGRPMTSMQ